MKIKWHPTGRRMALSSYLSLLALVIAHGVNAFVAEALYQPPAAPPPATAPTAVIADSAGPSSQFVDEILQGGLFPLPSHPQSFSATGQPAAPSLPPLEVAKKLTLFGTALSINGSGLVIVEDNATKQQKLYHLHDRVPNVGEVADIQKDRVLFREGAQEEWLEMAVVAALRTAVRIPLPATMSVDAAPPRNTPTTSTKRILDRREVTAAMSDMARLLTQALAIPHVNNGKLEGFRLHSVMPEGFFDKIGLLPGDILQRVNGVEIRDPGTMFTMFQQLRNEQNVRLDLLRNSQPQTLAYEIR